MSRKAYLKVVGMLPHIDAEYRHLTLADNRILILGRDDSKPLLFASLDFDQPAPTATLNAKQRSIEGLFEFVFVAPDCLYLLQELRRSRALGLRRACWREVLPKEGVVDVTTSIELDTLLQRDLNCDVRGVYRFSLCFQSSVQVGDVGLVVLAVM